MFFPHPLNSSPAPPSPTGSSDIFAASPLNSTERIQMDESSDPDFRIVVEKRRVIEMGELGGRLQRDEGNGISAVTIVPKFLIERQGNGSNQQQNELRDQHHQQHQQQQQQQQRRRQDSSKEDEEIAKLERLSSVRSTGSTKAAYQWPGFGSAQRGIGRTYSERVPNRNEDSTWRPKSSARHLSAQARHKKELRIRVWLKFSATYSFYIVALTFLVFIIGHELDNAFVHSVEGPCGSPWDVPAPQYIAVFFVQSLISLLSVVAMILSLIYHKAKFDQRILSLRYHPSERFIGTGGHSIKMMCEVVLVGLHCPPFIWGCGNFGTPYLHNPNIEHYYDIQLLNILVLLRCVLFFRYLRHRNRFTTTPARSVMSLFSVKKDLLMGFKDSLSFKMLAMLYFGSMFLFAYITLCFERGAPQADFHGVTSPCYWDATYATCLWYIFAVMTTVGFGDWVPLTPLGRLVSVVAQTCSLITSALLIGVVVHRFSATQQEENVIYTLDWLMLRRKVPKTAVMLISAWWKAVSRPSPNNWSKYYKLLQRWAKLRAEVARTQNAPTNPMDLGSQVMAIQSELLTLQEEQERLSHSINSKLDKILAAALSQQNSRRDSPTSLDLKELPCTGEPVNL